jgi:hypothetical protein
VTENGIGLQAAKDRAIQFSASEINFLHRRRLEDDARGSVEEEAS